MDMTMMKRGRAMSSAAFSMALAGSMLAPTLAGCGNQGTSNAGSNAQPPMARQGGYNRAPAMPNQQRQGMSTGQKVAVLAGAAALYYMYNKHKNAKGTGPEGQYYRSKNGRVYYRDAKGNAVYVSPPAGGIQVPAEEAERYNRAAQSGDWGVLDGYGDNSGSMAAPGGGYNGGGSNNGRSGSMMPPGPRGAY